MVGFIGGLFLIRRINSILIKKEARLVESIIITQPIRLEIGFNDDYVLTFKISFENEEGEFLFEPVTIIYFDENILSFVNALSDFQNKENTEAILKDGASSEEFELIITKDRNEINFRLSIWQNRFYEDYDDEKQNLIFFFPIDVATLQHIQEQFSEFAKNIGGMDCVQTEQKMGLYCVQAVRKIKICNLLKSIIRYRWS